MDKGRFSVQDFDSYSTSIKGKPVDQVFTSQTLKSTGDARTSFDPIQILTRESRFSTEFPNATPIILAFDVTGTMGRIPHYFIEEALGTLMQGIFDRKPVSDPQIMCVAVGDAYRDRAPLQATQFETDMRIVDQLKDLYLEGGGGGNGGESYNLAHYFAATKTSTDAFEKQGRKGQLWTIGDEPPHMELLASQIKQFIGGEPTRDLTSQEVLAMARRNYDVFHVVVEQGAGLSQYGEKAVVGGWNELLGEGNVLRLSDYSKLSEVILSKMQLLAGVDHDAVVKSWSGSTAVAVQHALATSKNVVVTKRPGGGLMRFAPPAEPMAA